MKNDFLIRTALTLFIVSICILAIILAKNLLVPFAISIFFVYLLYPVVWQIEKRGVHRIVSILSVLLVTFLLLGGTFVFVSAQLSNMSVDFTELKQQADAKGDSIQGIMEKKLGINARTMDHYLSRISDNFLSSWETKIGRFFTATTTTLFQIVIIPVYIFFLLYYRTKAAYFIFRLVGRKNKEKALHVLREISTVTAKYMGGLLMVVLILAILNVSGLYIIGVPNAIVFGILAALLNIIPYFGTFIGGLIPVLYVLFTYSNPFPTMFQIFILFCIVQFLENNLITPNVVGNNIKINPLAIIIGLLLGNLIWGMGGMLIAVPLLAILKIIMRNVDGLKPFAFLISNRGVDKHRIHIKAFWRKSN